MNQTAALTHLAVPVVLHRWRVVDAWTTARYRSTQILRGGGEWGRTEGVHKVRKGWWKGANHPPGQKQYTTVHVDKVAEGVNIGAGHTFPSTVVQGDASGQWQRHQQISDSEVYGVDHRGWGVGGGPAEDIESQAVEDHTDHQHKTVTHLQQGQIGHQWSKWTNGHVESHWAFKGTEVCSNLNMIIFNRDDCLPWERPILHKSLCKAAHPGGRPCAGMVNPSVGPRCYSWLGLGSGGAQW